MELYLMRHAVTVWNREGRFQGREDLPLSEEGRAQAAQAGADLAAFPLDRCVVSPLLRARETAELVLRGRLTPEVQPLLIERDYGRVAGVSKEERERMLAFGEDMGMEPGPAVAERALQALRAVRDSGGDRVLVVSHGGVINQVLIAVSKGEVNLGGPGLKNLCLSQLIVQEDGSFRLGWYNKTPAELREEWTR